MAASDGGDNPVQASNFGMLAPTLAAPGVEILTTKANPAGTQGEAGNYEIVSGTSAATAIVSGIVGLFKSVSISTKPEDIKQGLITGARSSLTLNGRNRAGGVASVSGALVATVPAGAEGDENENTESGTDQANNSSGNTHARAAASEKRSSSAKQSNQKRIRRRQIAGPDLPNLESQKSRRPSPKRIAADTQSLTPYCSPSMLNCDERQVSHPSRSAYMSSGTQLARSYANRLVANQGVSVERLLAEIAGESELNDLVPLMRRALRKDHYYLSDLDSSPTSTFANLFTITADNYVTGFYQGVLARNPNTTELTFWKNQLKDANSLGSSSVLATAQYLGSALFRSSEYTALATNNTDYVTDLYWGYYQHTPDSNLSYWVTQVGSIGREAVRAAFAASAEFSTFTGTIDVGAYPTTTGNFSTARIDILNRAGSSNEDLLSGNVNFDLPILSLPGRAGLNVSPHLKLQLAGLGQSEFNSCL